MALHGERFVPIAEPMVKAVAMIMVRALFEAGHTTVIVDETNLKRATRDFWKSPSEWATKFLHVDTDEKTCLERARKTGDEEIQPIIEKMAKYAEPLGIDEEHYLAE